MQPTPRDRKILQAIDANCLRIFDILPSGALLATREGRILRVNDALCTLSGFAETDLVGMEIAAIVHPEDAAGFRLGQNRLLAGEIRCHAVEQRLLRRDGRTTWSRIQVCLLEDGGGEGGACLIALLDDVSARREAMQALHESERRYRQFAENLNEGIWAVDEEGCTTFVNGRMADMLGYTREEMLGQHLYVFMDDRGTELCRRNLERRRRGIREDHEFELIHKDGHRVQTLMHTSPIQDAEGGYRGALAAVQDISERKREERTLLQTHRELEAMVREGTAELSATVEELREEVEERRRAETLFRQLLESAPDAMVVTGDGGEIILVNAVTERLFGYAREELIGREVEILLPERYRSGHVARRREYGQNPRARGMDSELEIRGRRRDGSEFPAEVSLGPLHSADGVYVCSAIRDISQRVQAEQELRESQERFDLAVRGSDAGIWDWDLCTDQVYFSDRWKSMLGFAADEVADSFDEWKKRLHPEDRKRALETVRAYLEGHSDEYELEHRLRHKDGSYRWILARGALVRDALGRSIRMVGWHIDVTRRRETEEILRENEVQLRMAQRIQEHLLPDGSLVVPGFDIAGASLPADFAAGDHFDYFTMTDGSLGLVISDVSGHGFSSALLMASTHAHLRSLSETGLEIDEILMRANSSLMRQTAAGYFVTAVLARIDPRERRLFYASAGHPTGYVLDRNGEVKATIESTGMPLAIVRDAEFIVGGGIQLAAGDLVLLLTDGVLEAGTSDGTQFEAERALEVVRRRRAASAEEIVRQLCRAAREFGPGSKQEDDITALVVKVEDDASPSPGPPGAG